MINLKTTFIFGTRLVQSCKTFTNKSGLLNILYTHQCGVCLIFRKNGDFCVHVNNAYSYCKGYQYRMLFVSLI